MVPLLYCHYMLLFIAALYNPDEAVAHYLH